MNTQNVNNFLSTIPSDSMSGGKNVDNFFHFYLELSKCQGVFAWGIIFSPTFYHHSPPLIEGIYIVDFPLTVSGMRFSPSAGSVKRDYFTIYNFQ